MPIVFLVFITTFLLALLLVGFLLVNAFTVVLALFGVIIPAFGIIEYIRGYFNKDLGVGGIIRKRFDEIKNK